MTTNPILTFGDDGTPAADIAWLLINNHAWPGWRLNIVTAHLPDGLIPPPGDADLHTWQPPHPRLAFAEAKFASVEHLTASGDPRLVLSRPSDLLVIGPRGPGLFKALHLGSTAEWLLLHPPSPMLIARHGHQIQRVVVCADGSAHAALVTTVLAKLPWVGQLDITILTIDDHRTDTTNASSDAIKRLDTVANTVNVTIRQGNPTSAIMKHISDNPTDVVALGTRGLTGLRHLRLGSTASAIARNATCSVLLACNDDEQDQPPHAH